MIYKTINIIEGILVKEKQSKFIGFAYPIESVENVKEIISIIKKNYPKATHYCYAYKLGINYDNYRAYDDGEPNGTAGLPILHQLDSFGLTNTILVVVRYFGGTKLGVSGLIAAYKNCAMHTLQNATIVEKIMKETIIIMRNHEEANSFYTFLNQHRLTYTQVIDEQGVQFKIEIETENKKILDKYL